MDAIVRVACRDSGKAKVDAFMGEVLVTLEKIRWLVSRGEGFLVPEYRESGIFFCVKQKIDLLSEVVVT